MANGNDKKKSLLDYFGMKSRDGDELLSAAQDSLRMDRARAVNANKIEKVLIDYLEKEASNMEKQQRADMILAGRKDKRYDTDRGFASYYPGKPDPRFTEADPDTLAQRFNMEEDQYEMIVNQLLGRSKTYPGRPITGPSNEDLFREYLNNADEPTRRIIQMLLDDYRGNKKFEGLKLD